MAKNALITGWGFYAPSRVMTNAELERIVDTSDEWITSRTGIKERRIASDEETNSFMSARAARAALEKAHLRAQDVQLVIVGTCSPDYLFPATACLVQTEIGATRPGHRSARHRPIRSSAASTSSRWRAARYSSLP